jgi:hypothetical protein
MKIFNKLKSYIGFNRSITRDSYEQLRDCKRYPKCYDMTESERLAAIVRLNRNIWNESDLGNNDSYKL